VTAFARIDDRPIALRTSILRPDIVVVLDPGLLGAVPVTDGLKEGGWVIANTRLPPGELAAPAKARVATVDAGAIALAHDLGSPMLPIVNTVMLGALARATGIVSRDAVLSAVRKFVPVQAEANAAAASEGFEAVVSGAAVRLLEPSVPRPTSGEDTLPEGPVAVVPSATLSTAAWRTMRPVLHLDRCTRCNFCWKFCPDDAIVLDETGYPVVRLEYCKGCGICATECPPKTIEMVPEEGVA